MIICDIILDHMTREGAEGVRGRLGLRDGGEVDSQPRYVLQS